MNDHVSYKVHFMNILRVELPYELSCSKSRDTAISSDFFRGMCIEITTRPFFEKKMKNKFKVHSPSYFNFTNIESQAKTINLTVLTFSSPEHNLLKGGFKVVMCPSCIFNNFFSSQTAWPLWT